MLLVHPAVVAQNVSLLRATFSPTNSCDPVEDFCEIAPPQGGGLKYMHPLRGWSGASGRGETRKSH